MPNPFDVPSPGSGALPPAANPFRPGPGKVPPAFGSRWTPLVVVRTMLDRLAVPTDPVDLPLLRGVRGVGKTALMAYGRRQARDRGIVTLHLEADADDSDLRATCATLVRDARVLTEGIGDRLSRRLAAVDVRGRVEFHAPSDRDATENLEATLHDVVLLADHKRVGVLLTVDEVHEAPDLLLRPLVRAVHRHAQDARPLGVVLSGLPGAADALVGEGQTYAERLRVLDLGMLDRAGVEEALGEPFARDADVTVDAEAVDLVLEDTGGYPYFVQIWGEKLWNVLPEVRSVRAEDVDLARPLVAVEQEQFHRRRWRRVPDGRARDLVRALGARGGEAAVGELVADVGVRSASDLSDARAKLLRLGLLMAPSYGRLAFTVPGFAGWVVAST